MYDTSCDGKCRSCRSREEGSEPSCHSSLDDRSKSNKLNRDKNKDMYRNKTFISQRTPMTE